MPKGMGYGKSYKMGKAAKGPKGSPAKKYSGGKVAPGRKNQLPEKM